ncbi:MAG: fibrobacter succinogenes major paralogous domain-containing protein [Bacteroidia bacterium]|nr:fibrobacter succinogenes major paralogous domain-containing protein [Bacteroidia bacterium]
MSDIDSNTYKTIQIDTQTWMAENLKTTKYRNGDLIGTTTPVTLDISGESTPKYQWAYGGNENNVATYGRLYTWYAANDSCSVCPTGWHVPTDEEWTTLITYLGGESIAGGKLKEKGINHWDSLNTGTTNSSGFTALPGGLRFNFGAFNFFGSTGYWWSSTEYSTNYDAYGLAMYYDGSNVDKSHVYKKAGFSIRCVKD